MHKVRYTSRKIGQRIALMEKLVYRRQHPLPPFRYTPLDAPLDEPPVSADVDDGDWQVIEPDSYWARSRTNFAMRGSFNIPDDWDPESPVALYLPLGEAGSFSHPEALIYIDGVPYAACDRHHQEVRLADEWRDGRTHLLALHGWTGNEHASGETARLLMHPCAVVQIDQPTRDFLITARIALGVADVLDATDPVQSHLLNGLDEAFKLVDLREPIGDHFYDSIPQAHSVLKSAIDRAGHPYDVSIVATGHAHIDVAWLWTLGQTRRKSGRTFHTVLRLMEQFPEFHFTQSQPQLYDYLRQDYPELLESIKEKVAEGRWEPIGGMWIEADCNISGPESLARQFLLGRTFFREHFGTDAESPVLWLPDVFGYAWNLPQLIKEAGMEYFFTIKIGWNQYNRLPYDSFWWQGLDGTKVLTHFSTTPEDRNFHSNATYNANPIPGTVIYSWKNFQSKEIQREILMAFGYGDGGGGPTREMLENIREMEAFPATPRVRNGSVIDFFRDLEATSGEDLPTWNGELYLEIHRGTYTTQSRNKRANRKSEFLLHDAEYLATLASLLDSSYVYPAEQLRKAWELVCLNQFHDIIPGSSITPVYTESLEQYERVRWIGETARSDALKVIADHANGDLLVINPTGFTRNDLAFWNVKLEPDQFLRLHDDTNILSQTSDEGTWISLSQVPPASVTALKRHHGSSTRPATGLMATTQFLRNNYVRVEFNEAGDITRIYDVKNDREVLPEGAVSNQFIAFEDRPMNWDAWDIDIFYEDKMWYAAPAESIKLIEHGSLRATLEIKRRILNSSYTQRISLAYNSPRIDVETVIDWRERHIMLKAAFPVGILTPKATYEIQWGNVERPTHRNTSWDWARFETCAQKWVDLSEGDYGFSLLNDCKYGHDVQGSTIRITLLRSPTYPDPEADQGEHRFTYSLLPHAGSWDEHTITEAYALNDPLIVIQGRSNLHPEPLLNDSLLLSHQPNIVIETVKRAENGQGIIVRLYESQRRRGKVTLWTGFRVVSAWRTNILEENLEPLTVSNPEEYGGTDITFNIRPYQIVTLRLLPE